MQRTPVTVPWPAYPGVGAQSTYLIRSSLTVRSGELG